MSLLGSATLANISTPYYSGGGGGSGPVVTTSVLNVSSIQGNAGSGININGGSDGVVLTGAGGVFVDSVALLFPTNGQVGFQDGNGVMTGVSSINGAAYPPPGAAAPISTIVGGAVTIGDAPVNMVPAGPTLTAGKYYMFNVSLDSALTNVLGAPNAGDHVGFVLPDASIPLTIDLTQLAAQKAKGQPLGYSIAAPFIAGAGAFQLNAYCNAASGASTIVGASGVAWITPLN